MKTPARDDQAKAGVEEFEQGELFGHHFNARYPSRKSKAGQALDALIKGERLRQSNRLHIGWRLAADIRELKVLGWPVLSIPVRIEGRERPIAEYRLPRWVLRELGGTHG